MAELNIFMMIYIVCGLYSVRVLTWVVRWRSREAMTSCNGVEGGWEGD